MTDPTLADLDKRLAIIEAGVTAIQATLTHQLVPRREYAIAHNILERQIDDHESRLDQLAAAETRRLQALVAAIGTSALSLITAIILALITANIL